MSNSTNDVIRGALKLDNFIEGKCFTDWKSFIAAIPSMFSVEVPDSVTNVTVSNQQPSDDQRDNLWIRKDSSGSFIGLYLYAQGAWQQIYPVPNQIIRVYGDSRVISPGFQLVTDSTLLTAAQKAAIQTTWHAGGAGWYDIFDVLFIGF